MRIIRLALGIWMVAISLDSGLWAAAALGVLLLWQGVINTGCCQPGPPNSLRRKPVDEPEEIAYEEIT